MFPAPMQAAGWDEIPCSHLQGSCCSGLLCGVRQSWIDCVFPTFGGNWVLYSASRLVPMVGICVGGVTKAPGKGLENPKWAECDAQRVCLLPATWEVWALKKDTPGREKEGGGQKEGAGGRDECLQQAESRSGNLAVPILAGYHTAAIEEGQRQEEVSVWMESSSSATRKLGVCSDALMFGQLFKHHTEKGILES